MKKLVFISVATPVLVLFGLISAMYFSSETENKVTEEAEVMTGVVEIDSCAELQAMNADLAGEYVLTDNIDCSDVNDDGYFQPVGNSISGGSREPFTGTLDGQGYGISNLKIKDTQAIDGEINYGIGMFGETENAVIKNIGFVNPVIEASHGGESAIGVLVGSAVNTTMTNIYVTGLEINLSDVSSAHTGGLAGKIIDSSVSNIYIEGKITNNSSSRTAGAIGTVDSNASTVSQVITNVDIDVSAADYGVGGVIGEGSTCTNCFYFGDISAPQQVVNNVGFQYELAKLNGGFEIDGGNVVTYSQVIDPSFWINSGFESTNWLVETVVNGTTTNLPILMQDTGVAFAFPPITSVIDKGIRIEAEHVCDGVYGEEAGCSAGTIVSGSDVVAGDSYSIYKINGINVLVDSDGSGVYIQDQVNSDNYTMSNDWSVAYSNEQYTFTSWALGEVVVEDNNAVWVTEKDGALKVEVSNIVGSTADVTLGLTSDLDRSEINSIDVSLIGEGTINNEVLPTTWSLTSEQIDSLVEGTSQKQTFTGLSGGVYSVNVAINDALDIVIPATKFESATVPMVTSFTAVQDGETNDVNLAWTLVENGCTINSVLITEGGTIVETIEGELLGTYKILDVTTGVPHTYTLNIYYADQNDQAGVVTFDAAPVTLLEYGMIDLTTSAVTSTGATFDLAYNSSTDTNLTSMTLIVNEVAGRYERNLASGTEYTLTEDELASLNAGSVSLNVAGLTPGTMYTVVISATGPENITLPLPMVDFMTEVSAPPVIDSFVVTSIPETNEVNFSWSILNTDAIINKIEVFEGSTLVYTAPNVTDTTGSIQSEAAGSHAVYTLRVTYNGTKTVNSIPVVAEVTPDSDIRIETVISNVTKSSAVATLTMDRLQTTEKLSSVNVVVMEQETGNEVLNYDLTTAELKNLESKEAVSIPITDLKLGTNYNVSVTASGIAGLISTGATFTTLGGQASPKIPEGSLRLNGFQVGGLG